MEDGRREIWILNFAVSIASKNKNIEGERGRNKAKNFGSGRTGRAGRGRGRATNPELIRIDLS